MYIDYSLYEMDGQLPEWVEEFKRCRQWIEDALIYADGTFNIIDVADGIALSNMQFWPDESSAAISQIIEYPRKKVLHIFLLGGDMDGAKGIEKKLVAWGRSQRCRAITLTGRLGWSKSFLKDIGYQSSSISMSKEI
jgi:hypothetical protein